jgi:hypothetical protein
MNKYLAWFVTFNFINFSWIFFRANQWDDAIKVLKGMVGANGVVFSDRMLYRIESLRPFIDEHTQSFGKLMFGSTPVSFILVGIFVVLYYDNVIQLSKRVKFNNKLLFLLLAITIGTLFNMSKVSEFLYFNF